MKSNEHANAFKSFRIKKIFEFLRQNKSNLLRFNIVDKYLNQRLYFLK